MENISITQVGLLVGIITALIKLLEFVISKLTDKIGGTDKSGNDDKAHQLMVQQLELMNSNHLNHIESAINTGNDKIVKAINDMHLDIVKELSRKQ